MATTHEWSRLGDEIMDTRDLIAVRAEIQDALDALAEGDEMSLEALELGTGIPEDDEREAREIMATIDALEDVGIADWKYGEVLIREDHFEDYARQLADDIGAIKSDTGWPTSYIDWTAAAEALKIDYTEVDYRGTTYYVRA